MLEEPGRECQLKPPGRKGAPRPPCIEAWGERRSAPSLPDVVDFHHGVTGGAVRAANDSGVVVRAKRSHQCAFDRGSRCEADRGKLDRLERRFLPVVVLQKEVALIVAQLEDGIVE